MPYEGEESSLEASANFNKNIAKNKYVFKEEDIFHDKIIEGLNYLYNDFNALGETNKYLLDKEKSNNINDLYSDIYCIDGSMIDNKLNYGSFTNLQIGCAVFDTDIFKKIITQKYQNVNPFDVANLYNNSKNILFGTQVPTKDIIISDNGNYLSLKDSFEKVISDLFDLETKENNYGNLIKQTYLKYLNTIHGNNFKLDHKFTNIPSIQKLINEIRDDGFEYSLSNKLSKEVNKIMLLSENIFALNLLDFLKKQENNKGSIVILDGTMKNYNVGSDLKKIYENNVFFNDINKLMLISVQKSGLLNDVLKRITNICNSDVLLKHPKLSKLKKIYDEGKPIIIITNSMFKSIVGIKKEKEEKDVDYGFNVLYLSKTEDSPSLIRNEFVCELPLAVQKNNQINNSLIELLSQKIAPIFECMATDLYLNNKNRGVLLANVLAHEHVSLNAKYTSEFTNQNEMKVENNKTTNRPKI